MSASLASRLCAPWDRPVAWKTSNPCEQKPDASCSRWPRWRQWAALIPVSSSNSWRASSSAVPVRPAGQVPIGNSHARLPSAYRYCSTRWKQPSASAMTREKSVLSTTP